MTHTHQARGSLSAVLASLVIFAAVFLTITGILGPDCRIGGVIIGWFIAAVVFVSFGHLSAGGGEHQSYGSGALLWLLTAGPLVIYLLFAVLTAELDPLAKAVGSIAIVGAFLFYGLRLLAEVWLYFRAMWIIEQFVKRKGLME